MEFQADLAAQWILNKNGEGGICEVLSFFRNPRPRAYEPYSLRRSLTAPICGIFRVIYAFLPRYDGFIT